MAPSKRVKTEVNTIVEREGTTLSDDETGLFVVQNGDRRAELQTVRCSPMRYEVAPDGLALVLTDDDTMFVVDLVACEFIGDVFEAPDMPHYLHFSSRTSVAYTVYTSYPAYGSVGRRVNLIDGKWVTSPIKFAVCDLTDMVGMAWDDVEVWSLNGSVRFFLRGHTGRVTFVEWGDMERVTASLDGTLRFWTDANESVQKRIDFGAPISTCLMVHRTAKRYLVVHSFEAKRVAWFDYETRTEVARFDDVNVHSICDFGALNSDITPFVMGIDAEGCEVVGVRFEMVA